MNIFDRILLIVYSLVLSIVSVVIILFSTRLISLNYFSTSLSILYGRWETALVGGVLLLISLKLLFSSIKIQRVSETIIKNAELGKVTISLNAVESLVLNVIQNIEHIKDVKVHIKGYEDGVSVILKLVVTPDIDIPEITEELQSTIKDHVESTAGIVVKDIRITVENVSDQSKQKAVK